MKLQTMILVCLSLALPVVGCQKKSSKGGATTPKARPSPSVAPDPIVTTPTDTNTATTMTGGLRCTTQNITTGENKTIVINESSLQMTISYASGQTENYTLTPEKSPIYTSYKYYTVASASAPTLKPGSLHLDPDTKEAWYKFKKERKDQSRAGTLRSIPISLTSAGATSLSGSINCLNN